MADLGLRGRCRHTVLQGKRRRLEAIFGFLARSTVLKRHHGYLRLVAAGLVVELTDVSQSFTAAPRTVLSAERGLARPFTAIGLG